MWLDLSGAAGCFVVVGVVVVGGGGGGVVGGVVGCYQSVSTSIPGSSGQFRPRVDWIWLDLSGAAGCFVVVGVVVGGGGGGVVGDVVGCGGGVVAGVVG